jgi:hypothetical protein
MKKILLFLLLFSVFLGNSYARISPNYDTDDAHCAGQVGKEVCIDVDGNLLNTTDNAGDLGTSTYEWKDAYFDGTVTTDGLSVTGTYTHTGALNVTGDTSLDGAAVINDSGADKDVRIEGDTDVNLLFLDASADAIGISTNTPSAKIDAIATLNAATGNEIAYELNYTTNKATSGNDTGLLLSMTDTASPGTSLLIDAQVDTSTVFSVNESGNLIASGTLSVSGTSSLDNAVTINDTGAAVDFVVESDNQVNMVKVDGTNDTLVIGGGTAFKKVLSATDTLDFASIASQVDADLTITVTGALVGDACFLGLPSAPTDNIAWNCFVSASDTVTVRAHNYTGGAIDPASATYRVVTFGF